MSSERDHIFISYATEQSALSDWLARRLAAHGYAVWYDRLKLLGGENWPKDIDLAINNRTFRMLALLSQASVVKPNPTGEWLKGRAIGNNLGIEDFVIPLNTEGLQAHEIPWNLQSINYIQFAPSWADGLAGLLSKLESINTPKVLHNGLGLAAQSFSSSRVVHIEPEQVITNCFAIRQIPKYILGYQAAVNLPQFDRSSIRASWACRDVSASQFLAFHHPPHNTAKRHGLQYLNKVPWSNVTSIEGIDVRNVLVSLIHRCLEQLFKTFGLTEYNSKTQKQWYIPSGLLQKDHIPFTLPNGNQRWFLAAGQRTYPTQNGGELYRYYLSPSFSVLPGLSEPSVLFLRTRIYFTDVNGVPLAKRKLVSRRKHLCRYWFNSEWCARTLGIAQLLAGDDTCIRLGPEGQQQLVIDAMPIAMNAPQGILDELVDEPDDTHTEWQFNDGAQIDEFEANE